MMRRVIAFVVCLAATSRGFQDDFPPNQNWECDDCAGLNDDAKQRVYGMVRHALYSESREVYLNLDHSWMDRALRTRAKVRVRVVPRDKLGSVAMAGENAPDKPEDEQFSVVYSPPASSEALDRAAAEVIDKFLLHNPCYVPLHDPPVRLGSSNNSSSSSSGGSSEDEESSLALRLQQQAHGSDYVFSSIFIRLSAHPFHPTCQLYTYITDKQNPPSCPPFSDAIKNGDAAVAVNWLGNIGWANALHPLVEHLVGAMHNMQMLLTPRAWENGAAKPVRPLVDGKEREASGPWSAWADPLECGLDVFAWDPWSCFFISLSKCNTPDLHEVKFVEHPKRDPEGGSDYMTNLEKWKGQREKYGDAHHLGNEWEFARMISFVQRPNTATRARLRLALRNLVPLRASGFGPAEMSGAATTTTAASTNSITASTSASALHHAHHRHPVKMEPCLGMHVRHGDSQNDERGGKLDRSLAAHVSCAKGLAEGMGLKSIYMATDDNALFSEAPLKYPQYSWFGQYRALKNFTGGSFGYHSERSMQQEVANLLVGTRFPLSPSLYMVFLCICSAVVLLPPPLPLSVSLSRFPPPSPSHPTLTLTRTTPNRTPLPSPGGPNPHVPLRRPGGHMEPRRLHEAAAAAGLQPKWRRPLPAEPGAQEVPGQAVTCAESDLRAIFIVRLD